MTKSCEIATFSHSNPINFMLLHFPLQSYIWSYIDRKVILYIYKTYEMPRKYIGVTMTLRGSLLLCSV